MIHSIYCALTDHPFYFLLIILGLFIFFFFPTFLLGIAGIIAFILWMKNIYKHKKLRNFKIKTEQKSSSNQYMHYEDKQEYMKSSSWLWRKLAVLARDNKCQLCESKQELVIHHIRYDNLGNEPLEDLVLLCQPCHDKLHNKLGYSRQQEYPITEIQL